MFALADVTAGVVHASIDIDAPPERVFAALTRPEQLTQWWGSADTYRTHDWEVNLVPGGAWRCLATNAQGGPMTSVGGEYVTIDPPRVLEHTWRPSWEPGLDTTIRYELERTASGTRVKVVHRGFGARAEAAKSHEEGWRKVFGFLTTYLAAERDAGR